MDTFAALALATDPPTRSILDRKPEPKSAPLITLTMWKMIIGQSIYQLIVTLVLYFAGKRIFSYTQPEEIDELQTAIFNTFVFMQIFNQYNCRRLDNKLNIFEGALNNYFFIGIQFIIVGGQILIIFVGGRAFSAHRLTGIQWAYSVILGLLSLLVAILIRLIPDDYIRKYIPKRFKRKAAPPTQLDAYEWDLALEGIRKDLSVLKMLRGGRLSVLKYKLQHPREILPHSRSGSRSLIDSSPQTPVGERNRPEASPSIPESRKSTTRRAGRSRSNSTFGPAAAMAGLLAGSVAGWSPIGRRDDESHSSRYSHSNEPGLEDHEGAEMHSGTDPGNATALTTESVASKGPPSQIPELTPTLGKPPELLKRRTSKGSPRD